MAMGEKTPTTHSNVLWWLSSLSVDCDIHSLPDTSSVSGLCQLNHHLIKFWRGVMLFLSLFDTCFNCASALPHKKRGKNYVQWQRTAWLYVHECVRACVCNIKVVKTYRGDNRTLYFSFGGSSAYLYNVHNNNNDQSQLIAQTCPRALSVHPCISVVVPVFVFVLHAHKR